MKKTLTILLAIVLSVLFITSVTAVKIVNVHRSSEGTIEVIFDKFPLPYDSNNWKMIVDGNEMRIDGGPGNASARPNAPEDKATGLLIATDTWVNPLFNADFPCCGVIQIYTPCQGYTNMYGFKLANEGCYGISGMECGTKGPRKSNSDQKEPDVLTIVGNPIGAEVFYRSPGMNDWIKFSSRTPCTIGQDELNRNGISGDTFEIKLIAPNHLDYIEKIRLNGYDVINPQMLSI